jgi:broad specificity phosphatase PhoE
MTQPALILVRHGRPLIDPDAPSTTWPLCPDGREAVAKLAERLKAYKPAAVVASPEPKAKETADIIAGALGLKVELDAGLHEHKRPALAFGSEEAFRQRIAQVFADTTKAVPGGESVDQACDRLSKCLDAHATRPLVAVTHGTVLSEFLGRQLNVNAHDLWRSLHTPDAFVLAADGALITRLN